QEQHGGFEGDQVLQGWKGLDTHSGSCCGQVYKGSGNGVASSQSLNKH
ncbi:hypothetical protein Pgy4_38498, partial [Pseudomonas savastanoi pv. glycinea str. race 4]